MSISLRLVNRRPRNLNSFAGVGSAAAAFARSPLHLVSSAGGVVARHGLCHAAALHLRAGRRGERTGPWAGSARGGGYTAEWQRKVGIV